MLSENIKIIRKAKGISQQELADRLNVVRQTISKWEQGLSVPDAEMLISLSEVLETPVSTLLGESIDTTTCATTYGANDGSDGNIGNSGDNAKAMPADTSSESTVSIGMNADSNTNTNDLATISAKLEAMNLQLAKQKARKRAVLHWTFIAISAAIAATIAILVSMESPYLSWDYSDPETAVFGVAIHSFEWIFIRVAPFALIGTIAGAVLTRKKAPRSVRSPHQHINAS